MEEKELEYVTDCIQTGWVSSVGKYVNEFELTLADYTGVKRAVAIVNGTAALHIALKNCWCSSK
ncbi:DegT/DnrJ/EryC1/StrS family aminotransferase [Paenibacillus rhizoplanae]